MFKCIYFFVFGAFMGWLMECSFKFISKDYIRTPGILNTPFCILYGVGTVILSLVIDKITNNTVIIFTLSALVLTFLEYVTFVLLEKIYNLKLWDYSKMKLNLRGKVCATFSIIWGILATMYIKFILPLLNAAYFLANKQIINYGMLVLISIITIDFVYSTFKLIKIKKYA